MVIKSAVFQCSSEKVSQCPNTDIKEFAFIGRSNVGKSSLINTLTAHKGLAKVSSTPGKTRLINHFLINKEWYLVDLPGYGYARVSKKSREKFSSLNTNYITKHEGLYMLFVLIDIRHEAQKVDLDFINFLGENAVPFGIIFTKADKLSANMALVHRDRYCKKLLENWDELPPTFITSSAHGTGKEELLDYIQSLVKGEDSSIND